MSISRYALALLLLTLPTIAFAQNELELSIAPITTANKPLTISEVIEIEVTLTNKSEKTVEDLTELAFAAQSVSFDVTASLPPKPVKQDPKNVEAPKIEWGKTFRDQRLYGEWKLAPREKGKAQEIVLNPKIWNKVKLEKGQSLKTRITMPLLRAGKLKVAAIYKGAPGGAELRSKPAVLDIQPKNGKRETTILMTTNRGEIRMRLFADKALGTCHHFARAITSKTYNGTVFHRVIKNNIIQGGDPQGDGKGGPGFSIPAEFNDSKHVTGSLAMARSGANDSAGCQFYIALRPRKDLDNQYTVFGSTVGDESLDIVRLHSQTKTRPRSLGAAPENSDPIEKQFIRSMKLVP